MSAQDGEDKSAFHDVKDKDEELNVSGSDVDSTFSEEDGKERILGNSKIEAITSNWSRTQLWLVFGL